MNLLNKLTGLLLLLCGCSLVAMDQQVSTSSSSTEDTHVQSKLLNKQLIEAAKKGDVAEVAALLDQGADIDAQKRTGLTPLAHAAYYGHTACVKLLLERGAEWRSGPVDYVKSARRIVLLEEHHECAKLFWEAGSREIKQGLLGLEVLGETQLQRAILFCDQNRIGSLVEDGAYLMKLDRTRIELQNRLLGCAALAGSLPIMKQLFEGGADLYGTVNNNTILELASLSGRRECVQFCLDNGVSVDAAVNKDQDDYHGYGYMALGNAISSGSIEVVRLLLDRGASIDMHPKNGYSILFTAAVNGNYEIMMELIERGANIWERLRGLSLLHAAALGGSLQCFEYCLKRGFSLDQKDDDGGTALHCAAASGSLEVTRFLLEKKLDVNAQGTDELTPLHYAAKKGNLSVIKELIDKGADISLKTKKNETLLECAVRSGSTECVSYCLNLGVPINSVDSNGITPLYLAVAYDFPDCAHLLIARGADVTKNPPNKQPIQLVAALEGRIDVMVQLIAKEADHKVQDFNRTSLLRCAALFGSVPGVKFCLEKGLDVNARIDDDQEFPLHFAVRSGNLEVVKLLLDAGATIDARMKGNVTPLILAVQEKQVTIFDELLRRGATCEREVMDHAVKSLPHFVKACIDQGISVDVIPTGIGLTKDTDYLYYAATEGSAEVVRLLLARGAKVYSRISGRTPLIGAAERGSAEIMKILIEKGASLKDQDLKYGRSILHHAALSGSLECVKLCAEHGLDLECVDNNGWRPIHCAARSEALNVVRYLVEEKNASINCGVGRRNYGNTPLHLLGTLLNSEGVKYLLSRDAEREIQNTKEQTPLMLTLGRHNKQRNRTAKAFLDAGVVSVGLKKILKEMIRNGRTEGDLYELLAPYCYRLFNPSPAALQNSIKEIDKAFKYFMCIRYWKKIDRVEHPTLDTLGLNLQLWILTADSDLSDNLACVLLSELNSDESSVRPTVCEWFTPKNRAVVLAADASREAVVTYLLRKLKAALEEIVLELKNGATQSPIHNDDLARVSAIVQSDVEDERLKKCIRDGINRRFKDLAGKKNVSNDASEACSSQTTEKQEEGTSDK